MKQISNKKILIIVAILLQVIIIFPCVDLFEFFANNLLGYSLCVVLPYVSVCFGVFLLARAFTLKGNKKAEEIMEQQRDKLFFHVERKILWAVCGFALAIIGAQTLASLFLRWDEYLRKSIAIFIPIAMVVGLYIWCWFVLKHLLNYNILVGHRMLVVTDEKGKITTYEINKLTAVERIYNRKAVITKFRFAFPNGEIVVREEGFYSKCLIALLKDSFESRSQTIMATASGEFSEDGRSFRIVSGDPRDLKDRESVGIPWEKAEEELAKKVRSEARFNCIGIWVLLLLIAVALYCIVAGCIGLQVLFTLFYWAICILIGIALTSNERAGSSGTIYVAKSVVVCKKEIVRKEFWKKQGLFVNVETKSGKRIPDISCAEPYYRNVVPGVTVARVVKSEKSKPWIYYDEEDMNGTSNNGTPTASN